jgi:phospholipase C
MRTSALTCSAMLCSAFLFAAVTPAPAYAQTLPTFDHIVIIVQENRTPDNLFGGATSSQLCSGQDDFEPGVDIQNWGKDKNATNGITCFLPHPLGPDKDNPDHSHGGFTAMCDPDNTGTCKLDNCSKDPDCYAYVQKSDVQQYFDIATNYGFANYMFQTNEGPSFPAHQFLFSGTSGPTGIFGQNDYNWFDAENPKNEYVTKTGCSSVDSTSDKDIVNGINFSGSENSMWYDPPPLTYSYPCYNHRTLIDVLPANVTWKYYGPEEGSIWSAPTAIYDICGAIHDGPCPNFQPTGTYFNNVSFENTKTFSTAPIFGDINACNLAGVTWVIPDMKWSDHPGEEDNQGLGPDYVANLLDTIGESPCTNSNDGKSYWNSTAIFIVWDDWGGWYDHLNPSTAPGLGVRDSCVTSSWGCGYTYGFRVPLLVVSAYTGIKNQNGYSGYISGNTITQGEVFPYIHDFGSILAFTEHNFGTGFINPGYEFADFYAPDGGGGHIPLSDFFGLTTPRPYTPISVYHPVSYYTNNPAGPQGPGDGGSED